MIFGAYLYGLLGIQTNLTRFQFSQVHMGTPFILTLYAPKSANATDVAQKCFSRLKALDETLSDYQQNSELNTVLREAWKRPTKCSPDLFFMLKSSLDVAKLTGGAFDPTVGPIVQFWRQARKSGALPAQQDVQEALKSVGYKNVRLSPFQSTVFVYPRTVKIDFGGIAKGYACDEVIRVCKENGINDALIEAGGDIKAAGSPPNQSGWKVTIEGSTKAETLLNEALSTSGSTEQFVEIGGTRYSHIVDPKTGIGLTHQRQVTVIGKTGLQTDPLATAGCVDPSSISAAKVRKIIILNKKPNS